VGHAVYEVGVYTEYDYLVAEPCCLVGPRHKFSCKRLLQKQQREGLEGSSGDEMDPGTWRGVSGWS
jgi:hypothetical protein